jgi:hypothetical protein
MFSSSMENLYVVENCMEKETKIIVHHLKYNLPYNTFLIISVNGKKRHTSCQKHDNTRHFYGNFEVSELFNYFENSKTYVRRALNIKCVFRFCMQLMFEVFVAVINI